MGNIPENLWRPIMETVTYILSLILTGKCLTRKQKLRSSNFVVCNTSGNGRSFNKREVSNPDPWRVMSALLQYTTGWSNEETNLATRAVRRQRHVNMFNLATRWKDLTLWQYDLMFEERNEENKYSPWQLKHMKCVLLNMINTIWN
jgi:hypothetical protein